MIPSDISNDTPLYQAIKNEWQRQNDHIELIASENFVSQAVLSAQGSILTNKYAEGYPGRRYYRGCEHVDTVEDLAIERVKSLFNCQFANVQPHSGSQANQAVFLALLNPLDVFLGMSLSAGGHLTHGSSVNLSGKWFQSVAYTLDPKTHLIDYDQVADLARTHRPKLIIAGGSAYPRAIDFAKFREIADEVGAYLMVDMAHFSGLVAGGAHPSPLPYADVVTSTTHKTLRGPRGGIILTNRADIAKKIDAAIFPGLQGGPLMHVIAAKAVAFQEALSDDFKIYAKNVIENTQILGETLVHHGFSLITGGTDTHLILVDLRGMGLTGIEAAILLESAFITCNKNSIPFDETPPTVTSGIRLGGAACTTRGMQQAEFKMIGDFIAALLKKTETVETVKEKVHGLTQKFPLYTSFQ